MFDNFTRAELESLLNSDNHHCLSLYMPTEKTAPDVRQNLIRFKNLLAEAEESLLQRGTPPGISAKILGPLQKMIPDNVYWANQDTGLAIFGSADSLRVYRLPLVCNHLVVCAGHFHLTPLVSFLQKERTFHVLALSQNNTRLLRYSELEVTELNPPGMPRSLAEALKFDELEKQLQFHTGAQGTAGRRPAMFHGHGTGTDEKKENLRRYFQEINKSLEALFRGKKDPLIVASVDYLFPIYRAVNTYPHLFEQFIEGNPEETSAEDLKRAAQPIVEKQVETEQRNALSIFEERAGTGYTSTDPADIVPSARYGRVDTLFLAENDEKWGGFDESENALILRENRTPDDYCLLNFAAVNTIKHGGSVYTFPGAAIPGGLIGAIYRY